DRSSRAACLGENAPGSQLGWNHPVRSVRSFEPQAFVPDAKRVDSRSETLFANGAPRPRPPRSESAPKRLSDGPRCYCATLLVSCSATKRHKRLKNIETAGRVS